MSQQWAYNGNNLVIITTHFSICFYGLLIDWSTNCDITNRIVLFSFQYNESARKVIGQWNIFHHREQTKSRHDSDEELLRPIALSTWGYEGVDTTRTTTEDVSSVSKRKRTRASDDTSSDEESTSVHKRRNRKLRKDRSHRLAMEFELEYEKEMAALSKRKAASKRRSPSPNASSRLKRRRSFEYEELTRPIGEIVVVQRRPRPLISSSSESDGEEERQRQRRLRKS